MLHTLIRVPAPEGLDLSDLYPRIKEPFGVDTDFFLFVEDGEIRIKAPEGVEAPEGLADFLTAYVPPPLPEPPAPYVPTYADLRREAYDREIPIADQLDALRKGIDGPEWAEIVATANAIKAQYPKP